MKEKTLVPNSPAAARIFKSVSGKGSSVGPGTFLIDASRITECPRRLVNGILEPGKDVVLRGELSRQAMNDLNCKTMVRRLRASCDVQVMKEDYLAMDNVLGLSAYIDAVIRLDGHLVIVIFRYASSWEMNKMSTSGPLKKDVITAVSCLFLSGVHDAVLVYSHGDSGMPFHVKRSDHIFNAVRSKARTLQDYVMAGRLPAQCRSHRCTYCHGGQDGTRDRGTGTRSSC